MQRARVSFIVTSCAFPLLCPYASAQPTEGVEFEATKNLVVMIEGKLGEAPTQGAGIVFANQGGFVYIATAYHVVRPGEKKATALKVQFRQMPAALFAAVHHPQASPAHDLAVIRVKAPEGLQFRLDRLADMASLKKGDKVYAVGFPGGTDHWGVTYNPGFVRIVDALTLKVEAPPIVIGYSGGALIDQRSMLAGMLQTTDGVMAMALRMDRALEVIRTEMALPVQLSSRVAGASTKNPIDGLAYVWIPPGRFTMGCSKGDDQCNGDERPSHEVEITTGYWMGQTEVTQEAYRLVTGEDPSEFKGAARPVESVSWSEANAYCGKVGLRLPTEAEWEYAGRAGSPVVPKFGELDAIAWWGANSSNTTHDVGGKQPNRWNLHDTLGNVWEWVADWYEAADYQVGEGKDPKGPRSGKGRVMRGGSWYSRVRVSARLGNDPRHRNNNMGFRCAGELP